MALPVDLFLVRHGQSEGNVVISAAHKGDESMMTEEFRKKHVSTYRLTDIGIEQAKKAGEWLKKEHASTFGRYLTSEYIRTMETAALLGLEGADWQLDFFLREREWGDLDGLTFSEQKEIFARSLEMKDSEPFYWRPPNGESFADVCSNRIMWVLNNLEKEYSDQSAIIVCHEEVVWAFRVLLEKIRQSEFAEKFIQKKNPEDKMVNCQIFHYSRKDPITGKVSPFINWVRTVDPVYSAFETQWREIFPSIARFSNDELLDVVEKTKRIIN